MTARRALDSRAFPEAAPAAGVTHTPEGKGRGDSHRSLHPALVGLLRLGAAAAAPLHAPAVPHGQEHRALHGDTACTGDTGDTARTTRAQTAHTARTARARSYGPAGGGPRRAGLG